MILAVTLALVGNALFSILPWIGLLLVLLLASAFFSGSESAFFSLDRYALEKLEDEGGRSGRTVKRLLDEPRQLLATLLLGNELVNICISVVGLRMVLELTKKDLFLPWWANVVMITPLLLLFGEIAPKALAVRLGTRWAQAVSLPLRLFSAAITPVRAVLHGVAELLLRMVGVSDTDPLPQALHEAQFRALVQLGEREGALHPEEAELIHAVFDLGDTPVSRLMTPRADLVTVSLTSSLDDVLAAAREFRYSRLPVFGRDPDDVRGVLLVKDLLRFRWSGRELTSRKLMGLLQPAYFVPPGKPADELLQEFRRERGHMAVVIDEYGDVAGVVTLQDILEALFAPFTAEGESRAGSAPGLERLPDGAWRVPAKLDIVDWNRHMESPLPVDNSYTTVAGYIFHLFGRLPKKGETIKDDHWTYRVTGVEGQRLTWIVARPWGEP